MGIAAIYPEILNLLLLQPYLSLWASNALQSTDCDARIHHNEWEWITLVLGQMEDTMPGMHLSHTHAHTHKRTRTY